MVKYILALDEFILCTTVPFPTDEMFHSLRVWVLSEKQAQSLPVTAFSYVLMPAEHKRDKERFLVCFFFTAFPPV